MDADQKRMLRAMKLDRRVAELQLVLWRAIESSGEDDESVIAYALIEMVDRELRRVAMTHFDGKTIEEKRA